MEFQIKIVNQKLASRANDYGIDEYAKEIRRYLILPRTAKVIDIDDHEITVSLKSKDLRTLIMNFMKRGTLDRFIGISLNELFLELEAGSVDPIQAMLIVSDGLDKMAQLLFNKSDYITLAEEYEHPDIKQQILSDSNAKDWLDMVINEKNIYSMIVFDPTRGKTKLVDSNNEVLSAIMNGYTMSVLNIDDIEPFKSYIESLPNFSIKKKMLESIINGHFQ